MWPLATDVALSVVCLSVSVSKVSSKRRFV